MQNTKQKKSNFRASAVPLVTVDPYFSVWSFSDTLYGDATRHWTGRENRMNAGIIIDNTYYSLMGTFHSSKRQVFSGLEVIEQKSINISPLITTYEFENELARVKLEFITPLLLREIDILSRPLSYIEYTVEIKDKNVHDVRFYFDISPECCVTDWTQEVELKSSEFGIFCGNTEQKVLGRTGDNICIDWGYLHLIHKDARFIQRGIDLYKCRFVMSEADTKKTYNAFNEAVVMAVVTEEKERVELAEKYAANPIFAAKYPELATFKDEYYKSVATNIFDENLVVNIKFKLSQANGTVNPQGTRGAPELIKGTNNYLTTSDPGFVDYANGNYELKPDSEVFKKIPEFQNIDMSKMGNNEPVGPSN